MGTVESCGTLRGAYGLRGLGQGRYGIRNEYRDSSGWSGMLIFGLSSERMGRGDRDADEYWASGDAWDILGTSMG